MRQKQDTEIAQWTERTAPNFIRTTEVQTCAAEQKMVYIALVSLRAHNAILPFHTWSHFEQQVKY